MPDFLFLANDASLDLVNTEVILAGVPTDLLQNFEDLAEWIGKAGFASAAEVRRLSNQWAGTPGARTALEQARHFRGILRAAFESLARSGRVPKNLAAALTQRLQNPRLAAHVLYSQGRLQMEPRWVLEKPEDLIVPVAHSAARFFSSADYSAVRKCENPECILFFYDTSKNHSRRWCSMNLCGNRAKVSAFRQRL
jgi:predicted RNA-binding Zn ribbon-like protein